MTYLLRLVACLFLCVSLNIHANSNQYTLCNDLLNGAYLQAQDFSNTYLGFFGNEYASESIMNDYGSYGSSYSSTSVRNEYSQYGSAYTSYSANNPYTSSPPLIIKNGALIGYLTTNTSIASGISLSMIDALCTGFTYSFTATSPYIGPTNTPAIYDVTYSGDLTIGSILAVNVLVIDPDGTNNMTSNGLCAFYIRNSDGSLFDTFFSTASICAMQIENNYAGKLIQFLFAFDDDLGNDEGSGTYNIGTVASLPNRVPEISSTPNTSAVEDSFYSYTIIASDPDGDSLSITGTGPNWLNFSGNTLSGTPANNDVGSSQVTITLTDPDGLFDTQTFTLVVSNTNDKPVFTSTPILQVMEGDNYSYTIQWNDPDIGDGYDLNVQIPEWLDFNDEADTVYGQPDFNDIGNHTLTIAITDTAGLSDSQTFTLEVIDDPSTLNVEENVPAMGGIGLLALGLSMLGLGAVRLRKKS